MRAHGGDLKLQLRADLRHSSSESNKLAASLRRGLDGDCGMEGAKKELGYIAGEDDWSWGQLLSLP